MFTILNAFTGTIYGTAASMELAIAMAEMLSELYASRISVADCNNNIRFACKMKIFN